MIEELHTELTEKNDARAQRIKSFMLAIDNVYGTLSQLDPEFDLDAYCEKLNQHAETLILTNKSKDIALCSFYTNRAESALYVTFFGILKEFQTNLGVTKALVLAVENMVKEKHLDKLLFEVHKDNKACLYLARKHHYLIKETSSPKSTFIFLEKYL